MKKVRNAILLSAPYNTIPLLLSLEQIGLWFLSCGVDWSLLPLAFTGASISTYLAFGRAVLKPGDPPKPHPIGEWLFRLASGTVVAMVGWKDAQGVLHTSDGLSVVAAGVLSWLFCEGIYRLGKLKSDNPPSNS